MTRELIEVSLVFNCGNPDLNDFFINESWDYAEALLGKSYCFILKKNDQPKIVCAFTVSNDSIKLSQLEKPKKNKINRKIPNTKRKNTYPAVLIGRLGVDIEFQNNGIGLELMNFIKGWFVNEQNKTGCRFLVVDAYNDEKPLCYYKKCGFEFLFDDTDSEKITLFGKKEILDPLNTRLMYFDLAAIKQAV